MMNDHESVSGLTTSHSHRLESVAYHMEVFGLGKKAADNLCRGECLQEKGQLELALKYYQLVLRDYPECEKARDDARITAEILLQRMQQASSPGETKFSSADMDVSWSGGYSVFDGEVGEYEENRLAEAAAKKKLESMGYSNFFLKLVKNESSRIDEYSVEGNAHFRVTLAPDRNTPAMLSLKALLATLNETTSTPVRDETEEPRSIISTNLETDVPQHGEGDITATASSRFADASETYP